jgi:ATPase subunit of ABC transporter with duplicated ATPase domains
MAKSKARIAAYEEMLAKSQEKGPGEAEIVIPPAPRLGNIVIQAEGLRKGYGNRLLIDDLTSSCRPAASSASSGPNGAASPRCSR